MASKPFSELLGELAAYARGCADFAKETRLSVPLESLGHLASRLEDLAASARLQLPPVGDQVLAIYHGRLGLARAKLRQLGRDLDGLDELFVPDDRDPDYCDGHDPDDVTHRPGMYWLVEEEVWVLSPVLSPNIFITHCPWDGRPLRPGGPKEGSR